MNTARVLDETAVIAWHALEMALATKIQMGEDAITSFSLLALSINSPKVRSNAIVKDTRVDESKIGADFELWIGSVARGWRRYQVQAKRLSPKTGTYSSLNHKVGSKRQIDILDKFAATNKAAPIYCFYNFVQKPTVTVNCPVGKNVETLGISVTPSSVVRKALSTRGARSFEAIHNKKVTVPWSCLVECPLLHIKNNSVSWPGMTIRDNYFEGYENYYDQLPSGVEHLLESREASVPDPWGFFNYESGLVPRWIMILDLSDTES